MQARPSPGVGTKLDRSSLIPQDSQLPEWIPASSVKMPGFTGSSRGHGADQVGYYAESL